MTEQTPWPAVGGRRGTVRAIAAVMMLAGRLNAGEVREDFSQSLDLGRWQLFPRWVLTEQGTLLATNAAATPNVWFAPAGQWLLDSAECHLRVAPTDTPGSHARLNVVTGAGDSFAVMGQAAATAIGVTPAGKPEQHLATLATNRTGRAWETWAVRRTNDTWEVLIDGASVARVAAAARDVPVSFRLSGYRAAVELDRVTLRGEAMAERVARIGTPLSEKNDRDTDKDRFYADGVTAIGDPAEGVDLALARDLPPVERWMAGAPDFRADEFPTDLTAFKGKAVVEYLVGRSVEADLPFRLVMFENQGRRTPQAARFFFLTGADGVHTIKLYLAGAKNLANVVHVTLDGHRLMTDVMRGSNPKALHSIFREHFPVQLKAGPHVIEVRLECRQGLKLSLGHNIMFDAVGMEPGAVPLVYEDDAGRQPTLVERVTPPTAKRLIGRDFHYRLRNVPAGMTDVELTFHEPVTEAPGYSVFTVSANGQPLLENFDIAAAGGWQTPIVKTLAAAPVNGVLDLHVKASVGRGLINQVRLLNKGAELARMNVGCSPDRCLGFMGAADLESKWADGDSVYAPRYGQPYPKLLEHLNAGLFDGPVNVVADPGFEHSAGRDAAWRPLPEVRMAHTRPDVSGAGRYELDSAAAHSGRRSLRIGATIGTWGVQGNQSLVDWTRPYRFGGWVKGSNVTGRTYLQILWSRPDGRIVADGRETYGDRGSGLSRAGVVTCGVADSVTLSGTFDWTNLAVRAYPPRGATLAAFRLRSDDNGGTVWFDDLLCEGYGDLPLEIMVSPAGYHPRGEKRVLVVSAAPLDPPPAFELVDRGNGAVVLRGDAGPGRPYTMLGRHAYPADLSAVTAEGEYVLRVRAGGLPPRDSTPFRIRRDLYADLVKHMAFYFYTFRTGTEIPGYHQACHMDDALVASAFFDTTTRMEGHRDLTGGWLDAGDYGKFHARMMTPLYSLARVAACDDFGWRDRGGPWSDLVAETIWGADYLLKIDLGNGLLVGKVNGGFAGGHPAFPPSLETDGNPMTFDGMGRTAAWSTGEDGSPALALAQAALAVREADPARAAKYVSLAERNFSGCTAYWDASVTPETPGWKQLVFQPRALWTACLLFRATGKAAYRADAAARLDILLPLLETDVYRSALYWWGLPGGAVKGNNFPWDYLHAPMEFAETFPDSPLAARARAQVARIVDGWVLPHTTFRCNPFGVVEHLMSDDLWYYPEANYTTEFYPKTAHLLARAANVFDRADWRAAAERNLLWITGYNHLQASYVGGIGERQFIGWSGLIHVPGLRHGIFPGAMTKGPSWYTGLVDWRGGNPLGWGMPPGFAMTGLHDGEGYYPHFPTGGVEIWEQFNGDVLTAAMELNKAYSPEEKGANLAPLPLGTTNLLQNAGFELSEGVERVRTKRPKWEVVGEKIPAHWDFNGDQAGRVTLIDDPAQARHGRHALKIEKLDEYRAASLISGESGRACVAVKPGEVYWVSVWVRGRGRIVVFAIENSEQDYLYARPLSDYVLGVDWDRIDMEYRVPELSGPKPQAPSRVRFALHLAPRGEIVVDDFEARRSPAIRLPRPERLE